jgi:aerobic-type carbon monoxide dehydrogenase small subunit (CoxS/CutS family)
MSAVGLLERTPNPSTGQIRDALAENMCRCGTYPRIERAVLRAAGGKE